MSIYKYISFLTKINKKLNNFMTINILFLIVLKQQTNLCVYILYNTDNIYTHFI